MFAIAGNDKGAQQRSYESQGSQDPQKPNNTSSKKSKIIPDDKGEYVDYEDID